MGAKTRLVSVFIGLVNHAVSGIKSVCSMYWRSCQMSWDNKKSLTRIGEGEIILQAKIPRVKIYHVDLKAPVKVTHCDMHIGQIYFLTLETTTRPSH